MIHKLWSISLKVASFVLPTLRLERIYPIVGVLHMDFLSFHCLPITVHWWNVCPTTCIEASFATLQKLQHLDTTVREGAFVTPLCAGFPSHDSTSTLKGVCVPSLYSTFLLSWVVVSTEVESLHNSCFNPLRGHLPPDDLPWLRSGTQRCSKTQTSWPLFVF